MSPRGRLGLAPCLALAALAVACGAQPASTPPSPPAPSSASAPSSETAAPAELAPPAATASASVSSHQPSGPRAGMVLTVGGAGRLAADQIQRIVLRNYGLATRCYVDYARTHRQINIVAWVDVDFTIDRRGVVSAARHAGGNLPDRTAVDCLVAGMVKLNFDAPQGGAVEVRYRFTFRPDE